MKLKYVICLMLIPVSIDMGAQGFLKKLQKAVDKVQKTVKEVQKTDEGVTNATSKEEGNQHNTGEKEQTLVLEIPAEYASLPKSNLITMSTKSVTDTFATFKKTALTKIVNVDDLDKMTLGYFQDGRAFVRTVKNGAYCFDDKGNIVKQFAYTDIPETATFESGRVILSINYGDATIYDVNFKVIKVLKGCRNFTQFRDGVAIISAKGSSLAEVQRYIDINGNMVFPKLNPGKSRLVNRGLKEGLAAYYVSENYGYDKKWGFRDAKGNIVVPAKYKEVDDFSNGLAAVATVSGADNVMKWGFIDKTGKEVIPPKFTVQPTRFDACGLAMVTDKEGLNSFIDKTGNVVSEKFGGDSKFVNGEEVRAPYITPFCNGRALMVEGDNIFLVDKEFKKLCLVDHHSYRFRYAYNNIFALSPMRNDGMFVYGERVPGSLYTFEPMVYADQYVDVSQRLFIIRDGRMYIRMKTYMTEDTQEGTTRDYGRLTPDGDVDFIGIAGDFRNGIAPVNNEDLGVGYVNEQGEWIIKFEENEF